MSWQLQVFIYCCLTSQANTQQQEQAVLPRGIKNKLSIALIVSASKQPAFTWLRQKEKISKRTRGILALLEASAVSDLSLKQFLELVAVPEL